MGSTQSTLEDETTTVQNRPGVHGKLQEPSTSSAHLHPGGPFRTKSVFGKRSSLHTAVKESNVQVLSELLDSLRAWVEQNGADALQVAESLINSFDGQQMTPLMLACQHGGDACTKALLGHGANPLLTDRAGNTCLHLATRLSHLDCMRALVAWEQQHPDARMVNATNACGYMPLHYAVWNCCYESSELLLAAGASLTPRNFMQGFDTICAGDGNTPLHLAAAKGDVRIIKLLLKTYLARGDRDRRCPDLRMLPTFGGRVPYDVARLLGRHSALPILHPSTDWDEIFGNELRVFSPPTLAEMAAATLRWSLQRQLEQFESEGPHCSSCEPSSHLPPHCHAPTSRHLSRSPKHHDAPGTPTQPQPFLSDCHHHHHHGAAQPDEASPSSSPTAAGSASCSYGSLSALALDGCGAGCGCGCGCGACCTADDASCSSCDTSARGFEAGASDAEGGEDEDYERMCGICLEDAEQLVHLRPCRHFTCVDCMKQLLGTLKRGAPPTCPFCRGCIGSLERSC